MTAKILLAALVLAIVTVSRVLATVDRPAVNHITKELYVYDEEQTTGIFWRPIGEGSQKNQAYYQSEGYRYTDNPYFLDNLLTAIVIVSTGLMLIVLYKVKVITIPLDLLLISFLILLLLGVKNLLYLSDPFGHAYSLAMFIIAAIPLIFHWALRKIKVKRTGLVKVVFSLILIYALIDGGLIVWQ